MRIIAGTFRSRRLTAPPGVSTRPTSDRLRETLFNVLAARIEDSVFIDAYAGAGGVGLEAISRGARQVYLIENERKALRAIRANIAELEIGEGIEVLEREALIALRQLDALKVACDLCFLDPPYSAHGEYAQALGFLSQSTLIGEKSWVIAEHDRFFDPGAKVGSLERWRELKQGDAVLSFYHRR